MAQFPRPYRLCVWLPCGLSAALCLAVVLGSSGCNSSGTTKLTEKQQRDVDSIARRIDDCRAFIRSKGDNPQALREWQRAVKELEQFRKSSDKEELDLTLAQAHVSNAYVAARTPEVVAELEVAVYELQGYLANVAPGNAQSRRAWEHCRQATVYIRLLGSSEGKDYNGLALLVREELAYARQLADGANAKPSNRLIVMFDRLLDAEAAMDAKDAARLRHTCHVKQARRVFDIATSYPAAGYSKALLDNCEVELDYIAKIAENPGYTLEQKEEDKDLPGHWVNLIDEFARQLALVNQDLAGRNDVNQALTDVRKVIDMSVEQIAKGYGYGSHIWVQQSLRRSGNVIKRALNEKSIVKLSEPYESDFQAWLDDYLKTNPNSFTAAGRKVEFILVPSHLVRSREVEAEIGGREHLYLKVPFKGRSVIVLPKP